MEIYTDVKQNQSSIYHYYPDGKRSSKNIYDHTGIKITEGIYFLYNHKGNLSNEKYSIGGLIQQSSSYFARLRLINNLIHKSDSTLQFALENRLSHSEIIAFNQEQSNIQSYHLTGYGKLEQANLNTNNKAIKAAGTETSNHHLIDFNINPKVYGNSYYDPESQLQFMSARYYSMDTQQFISQDNYNLLNRYNYANNNPVMNYDPDGHKSLLKKITGSIWKGINSRAGVYTMNGIGIGLSLASSPISSDISLGVTAGKITGTLSGIFGIATQFGGDFSNNKKLKQSLNLAALTFGIADIVVGGATLSGAIHGTLIEVRYNSNPIFNILTTHHKDKERYEETVHVRTEDDQLLTNV